MASAHYNLSVDDYVAYNQRLCARRFGLGVAVGILLVAVIAAAADGLLGLKSVLLGIPVGLFVLAIFIFVLIPHQARAIYAEQPSMSEPRTITVSEEVIVFSQHSGTFRTDWKDVIQWDETPRLIVLFINRAMFVPITKSEIGAEMTDRIRTLLIQSGLSSRMRKRPRA